TTGVPLLAFWVFQFAFADTCSTITSGAMVGRCGFIGDILYSIGVTGFIYPIIGHWAWGPDGWLATLGPVAFHDFAGSTVVHSIGGAISLAGAIALGPRLGRVFARDGGGPMLPHNIILGAVGGLILWFGWYGFNPGSTLSALDAQGIGRVSFTTTMAACSAGLTELFWSYGRRYQHGREGLVLRRRRHTARLTADRQRCDDGRHIGGGVHPDVRGESHRHAPRLAGRRARRPRPARTRHVRLSRICDASR